MFTRLDGGVNARLGMLSVLPACSECTQEGSADKHTVPRSCARTSRLTFVADVTGFAIHLDLGNLRDHYLASKTVEGARN